MEIEKLLGFFFGLFVFFLTLVSLDGRIQIQTKTKALTILTLRPLQLLLPFILWGKILKETVTFHKNLRYISEVIADFHECGFTFITERYWPWVFWICIFKADDADGMNHTSLRFYFIHMSFELGLFYTSYPEFRPWEIEVLVELQCQVALWNAYWRFLLFFYLPYAVLIFGSH